MHPAGSDRHAAKSTVRIPETCAACLRKLWEYLDEELPDIEAAELRKHVARCLRCDAQAAFAQWLLDNLASIRPEPDDLSALRDRIAVLLAIEHSRTDHIDG
jgi:hypothetical protein